MLQAMPPNRALQRTRSAVGAGSSRAEDNCARASLSRHIVGAAKRERWASHQSLAMEHRMPNAELRLHFHDRSPECSRTSIRR